MLPHLHYGDIIYHQPNNGYFFQKNESIQYQATLAITNAMHGTELGIRNRVSETQVIAQASLLLFQNTIESFTSICK